MCTRNNRSPFPAYAGPLHYLAAVFAVLYCRAAVASDSSLATSESSRELVPVVALSITQEVFLGVRWITLLASAAILVAVVLAELVLRRMIRRRTGDEEFNAKATSTGQGARFLWFGRALHASLSPLSLLIWAVGVYAATTLVAHDLEVHQAKQTVLDILDIALLAGVLPALFWLVYRVSRFLEERGVAVSTSAENMWDRIVFPQAAKTLRRVLPLVLLIFGISLIPLSPEIKSLADIAVSLLVIAVVALILFQTVQAAEDLILAQYEGEPADQFQARKIRTQVTVLKKIVVIIIGVFTLASMLMVFESVRRFGTSILASAGVVGIVIGLAAQRSIATLLAGVQVALTRPIRIGDLVDVENEWGWIEDITLTFVIIRIWDRRRLIVPINYFMERPFQNWTSTSSDILGTVFLHVDYSMPIQPLREELDRILKQSSYWNGDLQSILVTNAKEHTLEVRAMASAADGDQSWFLRCEMREKLVEFIQKNHPECLPRVRAELRDSNTTQ
jgi:small-conductance mechanosensitive channel